MKSIKTILLGTTLAVGFGIFMGTTDAHAESNSYIVQSGDTLSTISHQFKGDDSLIEKIAQDNKIENIDLIFVGEELIINTENEGQPSSEKTVKAEEVPVQEEVVVAEAPAATNVAAQPATTSSAKEWIAQKESSGSYDATNGRYIGRYQLDASYLNGDYSPENQERVADNYVAQRYGSWEAAQSFWLANGWY
ncbi:aggregation-promoting factor [Enterococcus sp. LJL99]